MGSDSASTPNGQDKLGRGTPIVNGGGNFVRNVYNWDTKEATSFWYVIKDTYGGIEELPTKVRNQVRKSLKTYEVRKVTSQEMAEQGYTLYNRSRERFKDSSLLMTREAWQKRVSSTERQYWLSFHKETGAPMAFAIVNEQADFCDYVSMGVDPDAPGSTYPMYGLILELNRYYLEERKLKYVSDGARSITEHSNIQPFLEDKFRFRKAYCDLQVFYRPWIGMAVSMLFPFRRFIRQRKVTALLRQEAMARNIMKQ